ncbi:hypothetical protein ACWEOE_14525 [Amycolatopsis sp. NPDC004368]
MLLPGRLIAAAFVVAAAAGCSVPAATEPAAAAITVREPVTAEAATETSAPPTTASTFVPAASPAKLSAACPFLDLDEYKQAFVVPQELATREEPPGHSDGTSWYTCTFLFASSHQTKSGQLEVAASPAGTSAKTWLTSAVQGCADKPKYLSGNAFYCTENADTLKNTYLVVTKVSHGQPRFAAVTAGPPPDFTHPEAYAAIAKTLSDRL